MRQRVANYTGGNARPAGGDYAARRLVHWLACDRFFRLFRRFFVGGMRSFMRTRTIKNGVSGTAGGDKKSVVYQ